MSSLAVPALFLLATTLVVLAAWLALRLAHRGRDRAASAAASMMGEMPELSLRSTAHRHVGWGMYGVLAFAAVLTALQIWQSERSERLSAFDAEVYDLTGAQRMLSQRLGRLANLRPASPDQLRATLGRARQDAQRLESLLQGQGHDVQLPSPEMSHAVATWQDTRTTLWADAQALLARLEAGQGGDPGPLIAAVETGADAALVAAQALLDELARVAQRRNRDAVVAYRVWAGLSLMALALLTVFVADRTTRGVRRQYQRLSAQAQDLERMAFVAKHTTNAVVISDAQHRITWVNRAFTQITGFSAQQAYGESLLELTAHPAVDAQTRDRLLEAQHRGQGVRAQFLGRTQAGQDLWLDLDAQPLRGAGTGLTGQVCVATDITERRQAQLETRIAAIAFNASVAMAITDANQVILKVNPAFTQFTGYSAHDAVGKNVGQLLKSGRQDADYYRQLWLQLGKDRQWQGEVWNRRKGGEIYPEWLSITALAEDEGVVSHYVAAFTDITLKKRADETLQNLAFYDPLTELPNRRLLQDRLQQAMSASARHQRHSAVLFMDMDRFKSLNDSLGHDYGDLLLIEVARRLRASVRGNDTVARQGGDEFVVVLDELSADPEVARSQAALLAEKIRQALSQPYQLRGHLHQSTPSIGVALFMGLEPGAQELLRQADAAMYEAKKAGRNTVRVYAEAQPA